MSKNKRKNHVKPKWNGRADSSIEVPAFISDYFALLRNLEISVRKYHVRTIGAGVREALEALDQFTNSFMAKGDLEIEEVDEDSQLVLDELALAESVSRREEEEDEGDYRAGYTFPPNIAIS